MIERNANDDSDALQPDALQPDTLQPETPAPKVSDAGMLGADDTVDSNADPSSETVARLANDVTRQVRLGKRPKADDLQDEYPELSDDVQGLVKAISFLEEASYRQRTSQPSDVVIGPAGSSRKTLGGFRLIREISRGGMGIVYEAEQPALQRRVALKILPPSPLLSDVERARFKREATAVARLHHSNIVPIFATGEDDGVQYCVMQYIEGYSLDVLISCLRRRHKESGSSETQTSDSQASDSQASDSQASDSGPQLSPSQAFNTTAAVDKDATIQRPDLNAPDEPVKKVADPELANVGFSVDDASDLLTGQADITTLDLKYFRNAARLMADAADALRHAHQQGVLHRDVKPGNLMLDRDNQIWVADFGLAKLRDNLNLTVTQNLIGTLRYTSPEQFDGNTDARSDIYSLGLTLYELCTLRPAFDADDRAQLMHQVVNSIPTPPSQVAPAIPTDLEKIIQKAIAPEPDRRYQDAGEFSHDLQNFLEDLPVSARRQTRIQSAWRWCRRNPREAMLAAFASAMLLLFSATATFAYVRESQLRQESDLKAVKTRKALDQVYQSYLPSWTDSSVTTSHGEIRVSPASATILEDLLGFYDDLSAENEIVDKTVAFDAVNAMRRVGVIYQRLGLFDESRVAFQKAVNELANCYEDHPDDDVRLQRARALNDLGEVFWKQRHLSHSNQHHRRALQLLQSIRSGADQNDVQFEIARTLYLSSRRERGLDGGVVNREEVFASMPLIESRQQAFNIERAVNILEGLLDRDPEQLHFRHVLGLCYREQSDGLPSEKKGGARDQAIEMFELLVAWTPEQPAYQFELCEALHWLQIDSSQPKQEIEAAIVDTKRSVDIATELVLQYPAEWIYKATKIQALFQLSKSLEYGGRKAEAFANFRAAKQLATMLTKDHPQTDAFQFWAGYSHRKIADLHRSDQQHEPAITQYTSSLEKLRPLIHRRSDWDQLIFQNLFLASEGLADTYDQLGESEKASEARKQAKGYELGKKAGSANPQQ